MTVRRRLGKYEIRRELGRGAMGVVYEAFDPMIGRTVAIKVLQPSDAGHEAVLPEEFRLRFRREAQVAGRLGHPNIVAVHEYAEEPDEQGLPVAFIVMEFVDGVDLRAQFDAGRRFTLSETGRLMGGLLAALAHAHAAGVIHRDIKPANVMLCADDAVKVADFGIARVDDSDLTQAGAMMGTVSSMAPEQLTGSPVDQRADLFSCGVILYELLTGEPPFTGSAVSVIQKVLNQEPLPPSTINRSLPRRWDRIVQRALAKKPAARFGSAAAFAEALRVALAEEDPEATVLQRSPTPDQHGRARRVPAALLVLGVVAVAGGGLTWWRSAAPPDAEVAAPAPRASTPDSPAADSLQVVAATAGRSPTPATAPAESATAAPIVPASAPERRAAIEPPTDHALEQTAWQDARAADSVAAYQAFLRGFPKGSYARLARIRLAALAPPAVVAAASAPPALAPAVQAPALMSAPAAPSRTTSAASAAAPTPAPAPSTLPPVVSAQTRPRAAAAPPAPTASAARPVTVAIAPASAPTAPAPRLDAALDACRVASPMTRDCLFMLGDAYRLGRGVARDPVEALRWYRKGAELGDPRAQFAIGLAVLNGRGVEKDEAESFRWVRQAAEQGLPAAQNQLGRQYEGGTGVPVNLVLAASWYAKAAEQGLPDGRTNLGRMYLHARGVFKDTAKAVALFEQAAAQGEPNAQYRLGLLAETGDTLPADKNAAARWYRAALAGRFLNIAPGERERITAFAAARP